MSTRKGFKFHVKTFSVIFLSLWQQSHEKLKAESNQGERAWDCSAPLEKRAKAMKSSFETFKRGPGNGERKSLLFSSEEVNSLFHECPRNCGKEKRVAGAENSIESLFFFCLSLDFHASPSAFHFMSSMQCMYFTFLSLSYQVPGNEVSSVWPS